MADILDAHDEALEHTARYIEAVADDQWGLETPCDGWDVRFLVNHIVSGNFWAAELAAGSTIDEVGARLDGDILGDDPAGQNQRSARAASGVFRRPGALEAPCAVSYGPIPGGVYLGHRFIDVLIHGWDVAIGTDQDPNLPSHLVETCWDLVEPETDNLASSGAFGDGSVVADDGAGLQAVLLAALGRRG